MYSVREHPFGKEDEVVLFSCRSLVAGGKVSLCVDTFPLAVLHPRLGHHFHKVCVAHTLVAGDTPWWLETHLGGWRKLLSLTMTADDIRQAALLLALENHECK